MEAREEQKVNEEELFAVKTELRKKRRERMRMKTDVEYRKKVN